MMDGRAMRFSPLLLVVLAVSTMLVPTVFCDGEAATYAASAGAQQPAAVATGQQPPDTNVLCVSKCGTCPAVCSSPPPPASPSSEAGDSTAPPSSPKTGGGYSSPSSPTTGQQSKGAGGRPSNYYYFFTSAAGGRTRGADVATVLYASSALVTFVAAGLL